MQFHTAALLAVLATTASAVPLDPSLGLEARGGFCSGSSICSNGYDFVEACKVALGNLKDNHTYKDGEGECGNQGPFAHCALFVKGDGCTAIKSDLQLAYDTIRGYGCQSCGWMTQPWNQNCVMKMDYVLNC